MVIFINAKILYASSLELTNCKISVYLKRRRCRGSAGRRTRSYQTLAMKPTDANEVNHKVKAG